MAGLPFENGLWADNRGRGARGQGPAAIGPARASLRDQRLLVPVSYGRPAPALTAREGDASPRGAGTPGAGSWATLMRRVCTVDVLACPRCGSRLRAIATVGDPLAGQAISAPLAPQPRRIPRASRDRSGPPPLRAHRAAHRAAHSRGDQILLCSSYALLCFAEAPSTLAAT